MKFSTKLSIVITAIFLAGFSAMFLLGYTSILFMGIGLVVILSTFLVTRAATKPLDDLGRAAAEIGKGKRDVSVRVRSNDEIGLLAKAFNAMVVDLKESENKYKDMAEFLPQTVFEADARGTITFVNRHTRHTFGFTEQDVAAGMNVLDVVAPGDHARLRENMAKVLAGERMENIEYTAMRKDGSLFPFLSFVVPVTRDGTVAGMRGIGIDIAERKRAEDELRQREWQLSEAQRLAHLGSWVWRTGEDRATWTDELYRMLGLNPWDVEPMAETYLQFVHPDDRAAMEQAVRDTMIGGVPTSIEHHIIKKDGVVRVFHSQTDVVRDDAGKPVLLRGIVRDITERKNAENEARERETFLNDILDSIQDGISILDADLRVIRTNRTMELWMPERLPFKGRLCYEAYHERTSLCEGCPSLVTLRDGKPSSRIFTVMENGAAKVWLEHYTFPFFNADKSSVVGVIEHVRDITERKRAEEEALRRGELVGRLNSALVALSRNDLIYRGEIEPAFGTITEASADALAVARVSIWFYGEGEAGIECRDLYERSSGVHTAGIMLKASDFPAYFNALREEHCIAAGDAVTDPRTREFTEAYLRPLGIASMLDVPIRVAGKVIGVVCHEHTGRPRAWSVEEQSFVTAIAGFTSMAIEIHGRKSAEDELNKLNEELEAKIDERTKQLVNAQDELVRKEKLATLGQLAGSVGHELRNPLGVMNNAVYFLQTVLADADETVKEYLGIMKSEIFGAERIVSDLLDAVRTKPPQPQSASTEDVLQRSLEKCRIPGNIVVDIQAETKRPMFADLFQMEQVFVNLINNAADAMPKGGRISILVAEDREKSMVTIKFRDDGEGITAEHMSKLFQPLFTTKARGIGLGLVVVKNLTEANGGKVNVASEPGKGTVFTVTLPAGEA